MYAATLRTSLDECYISDIEFKTFSNSQGAPLSYLKFSSAVKRFGYGGIEHLNAKHMQNFEAVF